LGQIGIELAQNLRTKYGKENVVLSDIRRLPKEISIDLKPYVYADVCSHETLDRLVVEYEIDWVIHNSSILSATGERDPNLAMKVNIEGVQNILKVAARNQLRVFAPSSIAAFGRSTPRDQTPDVTVQRPNTIYGVSKVYLELLGEYFAAKFNVDFRSLRYPGILSALSPPGGGTTDYSVEMFHYALRNQKYICFLKEDAYLPMMYMPDCLKATINLLEADKTSLTQCVYNVNSLSFSPKELELAIKKYYPSFEVEYRPDFRQKIAESWPKSLDDSKARQDWKWKPDYNLDELVQDMFSQLKAMRH